jgi:hypothetical protein
VVKYAVEFRMKTFACTGCSRNGRRTFTPQQRRGHLVSYFMIERIVSTSIPIRSTRTQPNFSSIQRDETLRFDCRETHRCALSVGARRKKLQYLPYGRNSSTPRQKVYDLKRVDSGMYVHCCRCELK